MKKVMYIEEDLKLASTTKSTLNYFQISVEHFSSWEKALHAFEDLQPDMIFIDITLKDKITNFDFVKIIRKKSLVPILFTSSSVEDFYLKKAFGVLNSDYIRQPFNIMELNLRINKMLYTTCTT